SAGSTAAQMAVAVAVLGRPKGLLRPAIATVLPTLKGGRVFLDVGVNADTEPGMLCQFARMGAAYAAILCDVAQPRVALLSNGTEEHKGNQLTQEAHQLLKQSGLNFIGNLEGRDILSGDYEVMVTDGFSGNIAIKSMEGAFTMLMTLLKRELSANWRTKLGAILVKPALNKIKNSLDYREYGGAPLLGVKGISIVCHGSSDAKAIAAAVGQARTCYHHQLAEKIAEAIS
ncbi:MAG: phosphate acyltransferase PlsX, partial [Clostridiales bacterium]